MELYVREGDRIVEAPAEDRAVAEGYPEWEPKGDVADGRRLTIMTARSAYAMGEEVRVIHVLEATEPNLPLYVMGPKPVVGERVDGELRTPAGVPGVDPLTPSSYDGRVLPGPGVDVNWEITTYRFDGPGQHTIGWEPGDLRSNTLTIVVT